MCSLEDEPWRVEFTGKKCRCGIPTPGTPEEEKFDREMKTIKREERMAEHKRKMAVKRAMYFGL
tara:strand:+ start:81 stop:272 length:192 start_codon:yes stop_codon:yes gene_type:complete